MEICADNYTKVYHVSNFSFGLATTHNFSTRSQTEIKPDFYEYFTTRDETNMFKFFRTEVFENLFDIVNGV